MNRRMSPHAEITATIPKPVGNKGLKMQSPRALLRFKSDEQLIALTRKSNEQAFDLLVQRYRTKLLTFCRHILTSKEDAEDVLQETFAAAYNAIMADERKIIVQPWLYRIARNRSLNHLRKRHINGNEELEYEASEHGTTAADKADAKERFHELIQDIQLLPETQRTALLLREMGELSYQQIADTMDTSTASVKSLLVRARTSLAEAKESRKMDCEQVRGELALVAEGLQRLTPPAKRHIKTCQSCANFRKHLKSTNRALAFALPIGPLLTVKKVFAATLSGTTVSAAGGSGGVIAGGGGAVATASSLATGSGTLVSAGLGAVATKTAVSLATAAALAVGALEAQQTLTHHQRHTATKQTLQQRQTASVTGLPKSTLPPSNVLTPQDTHQHIAETHRHANAKNKPAADVPATPSAPAEKATQNNPPTSSASQENPPVEPANSTITEPHPQEGGAPATSDDTTALPPPPTENNPPPATTPAAVATPPVPAPALEETPPPTTAPGPTDESSPDSGPTDKATP